MAKLSVQQEYNADELLRLKREAFEAKEKLSRECTKLVTKLKAYQRYQDNCEDSEKSSVYGVKISELEKVIREKSAEFCQIESLYFDLAEQIKAIEDAAKDENLERYKCQRNGFLWEITWLNKEKNQLLNYKSHCKKTEKIAEYEAKIAEVQKKIDAKKQELAEFEKVSILEDDGSNDDAEEDFFATIGFLTDDDSEDDELIDEPEEIEAEVNNAAENKELEAEVFFIIENYKWNIEYPLKHIPADEILDFLINFKNTYGKNFEDLSGKDYYIGRQAVNEWLKRTQYDFAVTPEAFETAVQTEIDDTVNVQNVFNSLLSLGIVAFGKLKKPIVNHSKLKKPPRYPSNFP